MGIDQKHRNIITAAYTPPGSGEQKTNRLGSTRLPAWVFRLAAVVLFVVGGPVGARFVSLWQPGLPLAIAGFWLLYIGFGVTLLFRDFLVGCAYLLLAWPHCDRCAGLGHPLKRTAVEKQQQLYTWACSKGHVFHTNSRLQALPHTRELHVIAGGKD